jgi:hypothetical protein
MDTEIEKLVADGTFELWGADKINAALKTRVYKPDAYFASEFGFNEAKTVVAFKDLRYAELSLADLNDMIGMLPESQSSRSITRWFVDPSVARRTKEIMCFSGSPHPSDADAAYILMTLNEPDDDIIGIPYVIRKLPKDTPIALGIAGEFIVFLRIKSDSITHGDSESNIH